MNLWWVIKSFFLDAFYLFNLFCWLTTMIRQLFQFPISHNLITTTQQRKEQKCSIGEREREGDNVNYFNDSSLRSLWSFIPGEVSSKSNGQTHFFSPRCQENKGGTVAKWCQTWKRIYQSVSPSSDYLLIVVCESVCVGFKNIIPIHNGSKQLEPGRSTFLNWSILCNPNG